eukprot:296554-Rhodomonas_salina.1
MQRRSYPESLRSRYPGRPILGLDSPLESVPECVLQRAAMNFGDVLVQKDSPARASENHVLPGYPEFLGFLPRYPGYPEKQKVDFGDFHSISSISSISTTRGVVLPRVSANSSASGRHVGIRALRPCFRYGYRDVGTECLQEFVRALVFVSRRVLGTPGEARPLFSTRVPGYPGTRLRGTIVARSEAFVSCDGSDTGATNFCHCHGDETIRD